MASFQQHTVLYYTEGFALRQLATFTRGRVKTDLINYIEDIGGTVDGDWYKFSDFSGGHKATARAREYGGIVYDLPVKPHEHK